MIILVSEVQVKASVTNSEVAWQIQEKQQFFQVRWTTAITFPVC